MEQAEDMSSNAVPHSVILVSRDPLVTLAIEAAPGGRLHLLQHSGSPAGIRWPKDDHYSVVLDVGPNQRRSAYEAVRRHHAGRLVLILGPDEPELPPDPSSLTIKRPFRSIDLLQLLAAPVPAVPRSPQHAVVAGAEAPQVHARARPTALTQARIPLPARPPQPGTPQPTPTAGARMSAIPVTSPPKASMRQRLPLGRRILVAALLASTIGVLTFIAWFLGGILEAARDLGASSQAVRTKLTQVDAALAEGDSAEASAAVDRARTDLGTALQVAHRRTVRMAAHVPVLSASVVDLQHLLNSAAYVVQGADRAVSVYAKFGTDRPTLLRDYRVDLSVLAQTGTETDALLEDVANARAELVKVRGGLLEPGVDNARADGLAQLEAVEGRIRPIESFLHITPSLLGLEEERTYIVVLTNLAQSRPSGGTPEAVVRLRVHDGLIAIQGRPAGIVENLQGTRVSWRALPEDPWRPGAVFDELADANSSPHFPTSGEELLRAYQATGAGPADGVVSVDPLALRGLLTVTGGLVVPGYGRFTGDNVATLVMRDAYRRWPDRDVRWRHNQMLLEMLLRQLLDGRLFLAKAKALSLDAGQRHLQVHMRDGQLREVTAAAHLDGALAPAAHDYLAAYTKNESDNRLDFDQHRTIRQRVQLLDDGSANVTRTMVISYPVAPTPTRPTARGTSMVAVYLPPAATELTVRVNGRPVRADRAQEAGRPFVRVGVMVRPTVSVVVEVAYRLTSAAEDTADGLRYELATDPQPMVHPARLTLEVAVPDGMTAKPGQGWSILGRTATRTMPFTATLTSQLELNHA
jgi:hypothetical protein